MSRTREATLKPPEEVTHKEVHKDGHTEQTMSSHQAQDTQSQVSVDNMQRPSETRRSERTPRPSDKGKPLLDNKVKDLNVH